jgi:hypothetical protein
MAEPELVATVKWMDVASGRTMEMTIFERYFTDTYGQFWIRVNCVSHNTYGTRYVNLAIKSWNARPISAMLAETMRRVGMPVPVSYEVIRPEA